MTDANASSPIVIGRFGKAFGILGWIKVISFTTPKENILKIKPWFIKKNNLWVEVYFEQSRKHADRLVVKLPNCSSPEEASRFTNIEIAVLREQLPRLPASEYYWADLINLTVINQEGVSLGVVQDLMATGANDVLVVRGEHRRLIPYVSSVILKVDLVNKIIHVDWDKDF